MSVQSSGTGKFQGAHLHLEREVEELSDGGVIEEVLRYLDPHFQEPAVSQVQPDFHNGLRLALVGSAAFWLLAAFVLRSFI